MTTAAYYALHYGKEWLKWSLRSVVDSVDKVFIFYTSQPSFSHTTTLRNPDTRQDLVNIALEFEKRGYKIEWKDAPRHLDHEGIHRTWAVEECYRQGFDTILVVDQDELWCQAYLDKALEKAKTSDARTILVNMVHFFRSLHWACYDGAWPSRIIKPGNQADKVEYFHPEDIGHPFHMGYAQSSALIRYKMSIHGHKGEIRPGWFEDIFMKWVPGMGDVHPTSVNYWTPEPYKDPLRTLEYLVWDHPYWNMEIIP